MFQSAITAAAPDPDSPAAFRAQIDLETNGEYARFRRTLTPAHRIVWRDLACAYAWLAAVLAATAQAGGLVSGLIAAAAGAVAAGYGIAYIQLFIHEAAHYHLAADRGLNDRLANRLICWQVGTDIASYRRTHFDHHRFLGDDRDSERSYRNALTLGFILKMATGLHAIAVFAQRGGSGETAEAPRKSLLPLVRGIAGHSVLIAILIVSGGWPAALAWVGGMGVVFPLLATLRQMIEHRPVGSESPSGLAVTRLFGDDLFSRTFGGAGFNRHLLHHLEPQISYTRLGELDSYLAGTSAAPVLAARRASYLGVCRDLLSDGRRL